MNPTDRTIHAATSEINLPGLEAKYFELVRWDGDTLRFNDNAYAQSNDLIRVTNMSGPWDDPGIRQERTPRAGTYGNRGGLVLYDEQPITLEGYVKAGNFPMLRKLQRDIKQHLSFRTIGHSDDELWKLRIYSINYFENLVKNPSVETNTTGWGTTNATLSQPTGVAGTTGTNALRATSTVTGTFDFYYNAGGSPRMPVVGGRTYTAAVDLLASTGGRTLQLKISWFDSSGNSISNDVVTISGTGRKSLTAVAPLNAAQASVTVGATTTGSIGDTITIDAMTFIEGTRTAYIDGAQSGMFWTGTAHASTSFAGNRWEMLYVQPAGIQMPEKQDGMEFKRPFMVTLKAGDPRIYTPEVATTWLYAASKTLTIGGDAASPVKVRINGPIVNPTISITQTGGVSPVAYAEEIAIKLTATLTAGQYIDFDPWENTLVHSAGGSIVMTTGNKYNDLTPGTYSVVMGGTGTDGSNTSVTVTQRDAVV